MKVRNSLCFSDPRVSLILIPAEYFWKYPGSVSCVFSNKKSVRDHRASIVPFASSSLLWMATAAPFGEWALPLCGHPSLLQSSGRCSSCAFREHQPRLVPLSLQAALLSHCTSITAASMRLPYPPGRPATCQPGWVLQCLGAHVCVVQTMYL